MPDGRVVGTIRRECLDILIPLGQRHLKHLLNRWVLHYNHGLVHMSGTGDIRLLLPRPTSSIDIDFLRAIECVTKLCWAACTTSTG